MMKKRMNRTIYTLLTGVLAGVLVLGCGKTEEKVPDETGSSSVSSPEVSDNSESINTDLETSEEKDEIMSESSEESNEDSLQGEEAEKEKETDEETVNEKTTDEKTEKKNETASSDGFDSDNGKTLDKIFENCAAIGEGVAGGTLKRTEQAYEVASYAAKNAFTEGSFEALRSAFSKRYQALDSDGKESFTGAFDGEIISLLDQAILKGDFDSIRGQFDDVGKAEDMDRLLKKEGLKESWKTVKKAYRKMEKGDD